MVMRSNDIEDMRKRKGWKGRMSFSEKLECHLRGRGYDGSKMKHDGKKLVEECGQGTKYSIGLHGTNDLWTGKKDA